MAICLGVERGGPRSVRNRNTSWLFETKKGGTKRAGKRSKEMEGGEKRTPMFGEGKPFPELSSWEVQIRRGGPRKRKKNQEKKIMKRSEN